MQYISFDRFYRLALSLSLLLSACQRNDPDMQQLHAYLNSTALELSVATSPHDFFTIQNNNLNLNGNHGIWFQLPNPGKICLGMDSMPSDTDVGFLDSNKNIVEIQTLQAHGAQGCPHQDITGLLEMPTGWFQQHQISTGTHLTQ